MQNIALLNRNQRNEQLILTLCFKYTFDKIQIGRI